jgi:hypothetical protein
MVVVSNSYPVTPTFNLLNGMLTVYLPPYDTPVTDPELVLKFVELVSPRFCRASLNCAQSKPMPHLLEVLPSQVQTL